MLFDLDGVIVDSESIYTGFWQEIDRIYPTDVPDFAIAIKGTTLVNILNRYFAPELHHDITEELNELERNMRYIIKPGILQLLEGLRERNIPAVMVTSSNDLKMSRLWSQLPELKGYFSDIITADDITRSKPDPQGYLLGAERAGVPAERCAVFEDALQGVAAGKAAGAFVVGVAGTIPNNMLHQDADLVVNSLEDFNIDALASVLSSR